MKTMMIVTGMSGAGKSLVMKTLEDVGYYCIDNMPPALIPRFYEMSDCFASMPNEIAFGIDIRGLEMLGEMSKTVEYLRKNKQKFKLLFLEASDAVLTKRYNETRRRHPLQSVYNDTLDNLFVKERKAFVNIKLQSDIIIDTSFLTNKQLKEEIHKGILGGNADTMGVTILSFGFKYGIPLSVDLVFDVRCLPNPFYIENLKYKTGLDQEVRDYVYSFEQSEGMYKRILDLIRYSLPLYQAEGKSQLEIGIGCTGGKHRSVSFVEHLVKEIQFDNLIAHKMHRDIDKM